MSLLHIVEAGLTTTFAIAVATGISDVSVVTPTAEQREILDRLFRNYRTAIKFVNAESVKGRL